MAREWHEVNRPQYGEAYVYEYAGVLVHHVGRNLVCLPVSFGSRSHVEDQALGWFTSDVGTWGPAVFSNDLSADLKGDFKDLIGDGLDAEQATNQLVTEYEMRRPPDADPDLAVDFWLALAVAQHNLGRLLPSVRDAAVAAVRDPRELERWDPKLRSRRKAALDKAVALLATEQRSAKRVPKRVRHDTRLELGQHVIYTLDSGRRILLRVVRIHEDKGGRGPQVALLDWQESARPPRRPEALPVAQNPMSAGRREEGMGFLLFGNPNDPDDRLQLLPEPKARLKFGRQKTAASAIHTAAYVTPWSDLDRWFDAMGVAQMPSPRG